MEETKQLAELTAAQFWFILVPIAGVFVVFCLWLIYKIFMSFIWTVNYIFYDTDRKNPLINKVLLFPILIVLFIICLIMARIAWAIVLLAVAFVVQKVTNHE